MTYAGKTVQIQRGKNAGRIGRVVSVFACKGGRSVLIHKRASAGCPSRYFTTGLGNVKRV